MTIFEYMRETCRDFQAVYNDLPEHHPLKEKLAKLMIEMSRIGHSDDVEGVEMKDGVTA